MHLSIGKLWRGHGGFQLYSCLYLFAQAEGNEAEATANGSKSKVTRLPRRRRGGLGRNRGTREAAGVESDATTAQQSSLTVNPTTSTNATSEAEATDGSKPTAQATSTSAAPAN